MNDRIIQKDWDASRFGKRVHSIREISVKYEGADDPVVTRVPDISTGGMFINTPRRFPEGAVLDLRFRLEYTGAEVQTRGEVRYCLPGVGVGVEFIGIPESALRAILAEIRSATRARPAGHRPATSTKSRRSRPKLVRRTPRKPK
ncbi:MAG: PilZ domain-containing protein [Candidatus Acidiferrales bacterium]